jgi:pSer/pThr/pTyr-binding forkhead associated (FHA) protein
LRLIQEGGGDGEVYKVDTDEIVIGRNNGDIRFPHDGYMSGRHARIVRRGEKFVLVDENSRNGTFKRIDGEVELKTGDIILIGKQLFRFEV